MFYRAKSHHQFGLDFNAYRFPRLIKLKTCFSLLHNRTAGLQINSALSVWVRYEVSKVNKNDTHVLVTFVKRFDIGMILWIANIKA